MHTQHLVGDSPTFERIEKDFYATPRWVTLALLQKEHIKGVVWEPACGNGAMAKLLPGEVFASDIVDRGFGEAGYNFLDDDCVANFTRRHELLGGENELDWIVTNPPYAHAEAFVRQACKLAPNVAMLLKLNFLEGQKRYKLFKDLPPDVVYVLSRRPSFDDGNNARARENGLLAYAWFVWRPYKERCATKLDWIL